jgi:hypothetical protein
MVGEEVEFDAEVFDENNISRNIVVNGKIEVVKYYNRTATVIFQNPKDLRQTERRDFPFDKLYKRTHAEKVTKEKEWEIKPVLCYNDVVEWYYRDTDPMSMEKFTNGLKQLAQSKINNQ